MSEDHRLIIPGELIEQHDVGTFGGHRTRARNQTGIGRGGTLTGMAFGTANLLRIRGRAICPDRRSSNRLPSPWNANEQDQQADESCHTNECALHRRPFLLLSNFQNSGKTSMKTTAMMYSIPFVRLMNSCNVTGLFMILLSITSGYGFCPQCAASVRRGVREAGKAVLMFELLHGVCVGGPGRKNESERGYKQPSSKSTLQAKPQAHFPAVTGVTRQLSAISRSRQ